jgi:REP element-mobilizing transposase RayT
MRLPEYDYAQPGGYFVTICVGDRACLFGRVADGRVALNRCGDAVRDAWHDLATRFRAIELDAFIVMPNHVHGLIEIYAAMPRGLIEIVGAFKSISARHVNTIRGTGGPVWQRGFYEHVVRDESDRDRIRTYIDENPMKWDLDEENPERRKGPRTP